MTGEQANLALLTTSRADFWHLLPLIKRLHMALDDGLRVLVSGMHLSRDFDSTASLIPEVLRPICIEVEQFSSMAGGKDVLAYLSQSFGTAGHALDRVSCKGLVVLGDRFEVLPFVISAFELGIPIYHLCGGVETPFAKDNVYRHIFSLCARRHFVTTEGYRQNLISKGIDGQTIHNVGSLIFEGLESEPSVDLSKDAFFAALKQPFAVVTYHPVTNIADKGSAQLKGLLDALAKFESIDFVWTSANADPGGADFNVLIQDYCRTHANLHYVKSLGGPRYRAACQAAKSVIGNSSSGLIECADFDMWIINVGPRQTGRIRGTNVVDVGQAENANLYNEIKDVLLDRAPPGRENLKNPYKQPHTSEVIAGQILKDISL